MFPFIALFDSCYFEDDDIDSHFISLPTNEKRNANFILYALSKLDRRLLKIPFATGNISEFTIPFYYNLFKLSKNLKKKIKKVFIFNDSKKIDYRLAYLDLIEGVDFFSNLGNYLPKKLVDFIIQNNFIKDKVKLKLTQITQYIKYVNS